MMQEHLNPDCEFLFQRPKASAEIEKSINPNIWFCNQKIGTNPLTAFMSKMNHGCDISRVYTNHSIHVTGATFLSRNNFSAKQIMSVTGHHSINSLVIYQKVLYNKKLCMGMSINYFINSDALEVNSPMQEKSNEINTPQYCRIAPKGKKNVPETVKKAPYFTKKI